MYITPGLLEEQTQ